MKQEQSPHPILFFDGVCNVCNFFVDFILKRDPSVYKFASLQGTTAREMLDPSLLDQGLKTIVLWEGDKIYIKSQAILRVCIQLGWPWALVRMLSIFPKGLLDWAYDLFSSHRYQWFGKKTLCRMPTLEERNRFLA
jgi:predicted DCC family thiol-disulfide oxidoreductase YuxK